MDGESEQAGTIDWLMSGDPSIAYQTARDLLQADRPDLQQEIPKSGWGKAFLNARSANGGWGDSYYAPKRACTHYVLLDLINMSFPSDHAGIQQLVQKIARQNIAHDGGLGVFPNEKKSDTCITAVFLNVACYFGLPEDHLKTFIDFLIAHQIPDGGFNCQVNRSGCRSSSLHSTISVLEALQRLEANTYQYRSSELQLIAEAARAFIRRHRFFRSERTGQVIHPSFLKLPYPTRWYYNILRGLDHFRAANQKHHASMEGALNELRSLQRADGRWPRMAKIPGQAILDFETGHGASRWNTLMALRVLKHFSNAKEEFTPAAGFSGSDRSGHADGSPQLAQTAK